MTAYLFQCQGTDVFAVSLDKTGAAIPAASDSERWLLRDEFQLGMLHPIPAPIDPDQVLRGIEANGYFLFDLAER